jgi:hypothetical protein
MQATETWGPSTLTISGTVTPPTPNALTLSPSTVAPGQSYSAIGSAGPLSDGTTVPDGTTLYVYVDGTQVASGVMSGGQFAITVTDPATDTSTSHSVVVSTSATFPGVPIGTSGLSAAENAAATATTSAEKANSPSAPQLAQSEQVKAAQAAASARSK